MTCFLKWCVVIGQKAFESIELISKCSSSTTLGTASGVDWTPPSLFLFCYTVAWNITLS